GDPRVSHLDDLGEPTGLARRLLIYVRKMRRVRHARAGRADEAIGDPAGSAGGGGDTGAHPQWRAPPLILPRKDLEGLARGVLAAERKLLAGPAEAQDLDALLEASRAILHRDGERAEVGRLIADAHAENDAALGDEVERDDVFCHAHRVMQREQ